MLLVQRKCHQPNYILMQYQQQSGQSQLMESHQPQFIRAAAHMHAPVPMLPSRPRPCIYTPKHPPIQQQPRVPRLSPQSTVYRYFVVQQGHLERVQGPLPYHWAHWRQPSSGVHWAQQIEKSDGSFFFLGHWASQRSSTRYFGRSPSLFSNSG